MDVRRLFEGNSEIYAQARPRYPKALYEWLARVSPARRSVWDAGCGNGQAAVDLARHFDRVEATDVSGSQIANAVKAPGVRYSLQAAESTDFPDGSFDAVCVAQALHWFDHERFWPEVTRTLKADGVFAAWGYCWPRVDPALDDLLDRKLLSVIKPFWAERNKLLWNHYKDIPFPFDRIETPRLELKMRWSLDALFAFFASWSATRRCMEARGDDFFKACHKEAYEIWGDQTERIVSMDFALVAGKKPATKTK